MGKQIRSREYVFVILSYIFLTSLFTYPMIFEINVPYNFNKKDYLFNIWNLWWVKEALLKHMIMPYKTDYIFYPVGTTMAFHTMNMYNYIISLPIQLFTSRTAAYNILFLHTFILSAFGCYLLVRYLTKNRMGAFIGGIIFAFSIFHKEEYARINVATIQWIPLFCLFFIKLIKDGGFKNCFLSAIFLSLIAISFWEYFIFTFFIIIIFLIYYYKSTWKTDFIKMFFVMLCISAILVTPFIYPLIKELLHRGEYLYAPLSSYTQLLGLMPSKEFGLYSWPTVLGYTVLTLCIYFVFKLRREDTCVWLIATCVFFVFALGPHLIIFNKDFREIPLPFAILKNIPVVQVIRTPHRFLSFVTLGTAVMVGFVISETVMKKNYKFVVFLIIGLVILEYLAIPRTTFSQIKIPDIYKKIANDKEDYVVVDAPLNDFGGAYSMYYQTIHGKKVVGGYVARTPLYSKYFIENNPVLHLLAEPGNYYTINLTEKEISESLDNLKKNGIKYVIVHKNLMVKRSFQKVKESQRNIISDMFFPYSVNKHRIEVWRGGSERGDYQKVFMDGSGFNDFITFLNKILSNPVSEDEVVVVYEIRK